MTEITSWMKDFLQILDETFGNRVWFAGLQGSYGRGEATETDESDVSRAVKIGVCNIFHGCVHNMLYEKNEDILRGLYKSASFVVQAIIFRQTGNYIRRQKDLLQVTGPDERVIIETFLKLKNGGETDFGSMSEALFAWSKKWISEIKNDM